MAVAAGGERRKDIAAVAVDSLAPQLDQIAHRRRSFWIPLSFVLVVVLPMVLTCAYLGFVASPKYASSFRFVVQGNGASTGGAPRETGVAPAGTSTMEMQVVNFMISDYISSPQLVADLGSEIDLHAVYSRAEIDPLSRLDPNASAEAVADYWARRVDTTFDMISGLTTVTVHAFSAEDARRVAEAVMRSSETLANSIGSRPRQDKVDFLASEVDVATERLLEARSRVRDFRVRNLSVDPGVDAGTTDSLVAGLTEQYVQVTTQLAILRNHLEPEAMAIRRLEEQAKALLEEIDRARSRVGDDPASSATGPGSYAALLQDFEDLQLDVTIATENYQLAEAALLEARKQATEQRFYILSYVLPATPREPSGLGIPSLLGTMLLVFGALWLVSILTIQSIRDHL